MERRLSRVRWVALGGMLAACSAYDGSLLDTSDEPEMRDDPVRQVDSGPMDEPEDAAVDKPRPPSGPVCGDGRVTDDEKCDTLIAAGAPGACPSECPETSPCAKRTLRGAACQAECVPLPATCTDADGCCPSECTSDDDDDCSASCGDGVVDEGETCEPDTSTPCPDAAACDDGDPCTIDSLDGSPGNCNAVCSRTPAELADGDQCCPVGANANNDSDCKPECGNGTREEGEACDGGMGCTTMCTLANTPEQQRCLDEFADDDCERCSCLQCPAQVLQCRDGGDAMKDAWCLDLIECARANQCSRDPCYCGSSADPISCGLAPAGPCIPEVQAAAETTDPLTILMRQDDATFAIGRANALGDCSLSQCADVCP